MYKHDFLTVILDYFLFFSTCTLTHVYMVQNLTKPYFGYIAMYKFRSSEYFRNAGPENILSINIVQLWLCLTAVARPEFTPPDRNYLDYK